MPQLYLCPVCGDLFDRLVYHCMACDHHYPGGPDLECRNCYQSLRSSYQAIAIDLKMEDVPILMDWDEKHGRKRGTAYVIQPEVM